MAKAKKDKQAESHNKELGRRGEEAAARFLERRGYDIVARNWTCPFGEVDIVARDAATLVFTEVKTRSNCEKGLPEDAVGPEKRRKYEKLAAAFLQDYDAVDLRVRFDVVALLIIAPDRALIRHHIDAFGVV